MNLPPADRAARRIANSREKYRITHGFVGADGRWQCADCRAQVVSAVSPGVCEACGGDMTPAPHSARKVIA